MIKKYNFKQKINTSIAFTKNLFTTGAVIETSKATELEICMYVPTEANKNIVEFGMGHGNITKKILNKISSTSKLYSFEVNKDFCSYVRNLIKDERLIIINDDAQNIKDNIKEEVHAIIGSIPFSFFSLEKAKMILENSYKALANESYYSQILYSKSNKKFGHFFQQYQIKKVNWLPVEYVHHCKKIL